MMTKNFLMAVALACLAICAGCSGNGKNGNGAARVTVTPPAPSVGVTLTQQFTAVVKGISDQSVTWKITQSGVACSPACGSISANGLYTAPAAPPNPATVTVTATSVANNGESDSATAKVVPITVVITPGSKGFDVATGVNQQFTALAVPDAAPQTFTWSLACDAGGNSCGTIDQTGLYTGPISVPSPATGHVTATSTLVLNPVPAATADITVVSSRLAGNSTYAFRFSGHDNSGNFIAVAGNFLTGAGGTAIVSGSEDELTASQHVNLAIDNTSTFKLDANDHGTLTLHTSAGARAYKVALDQSGDGQMIEFDPTLARGSGVMVLAKSANFTDAALPPGSSFVFGLTGVDTTVKRTGYAGLFKPDGVGGVTSGSIDINDNQTAKSSSSVTGNYDLNTNADGSGTLTLTTGVGTFHFAIYVASGTAKAATPLTLFVISVDDPQTAPAEVGTIVFQDPAITGTNTDLNASTVSNLTGVDSTGTNTLVSLTAASGDGNGKIGGIYDANNAGSIVAAKAFTGNAYACAAGGRCTVDLLVPAVHFVLYLRAANSGFLLDQSSSAVMTGTMDPQPGGFFSPSGLAGPFAAATTTSGTPSVSQVEANLLLLSPGNAVFNVAGSQDETDAGGQHAAQGLAGTYDTLGSGIGTFTLTSPNAAGYVIYLIDNPANQNGLVQHFYIMNVDPANTNSSIVFAER